MRCLLIVWTFLVISLPSRADTFTFSFTGVDLPYSGSGIINASQYSAIPTVFLISSLAGTMNSGDISMTSGSQGVICQNPDGTFGLDHTGSGIYFTDALGTGWGFYLFSGPLRSMLIGDAVGAARTRINLDIERVPEPGTGLLIASSLLLFVCQSRVHVKKARVPAAFVLLTGFLMRA